MKKFFVLLGFALTFESCITFKSKKNAVPRVEFTFEDFEYEDGFVEEDTLGIEHIPQKYLKEDLQKVEYALKGRLAHFGLILSKEEEMEIAKWHHFYETRGKDRVLRALRRGAPYFKKIAEIIRSYGLPEDLAFLPVIESGFNLNAVSRRRAVGPWQFISYTAKKYGLLVDWWIDQRLDPIFSTHAACKYLKDLFDFFGRWDLAIAAYNAGEGKVYSRLVKTNGEKFWDIRRQLKRETRNYVPSFLALIIFINNNKALVDSVLNVPEFTYDSVLVPAQANIKQLASWAGISEREFRFYNPYFHRFATPPDLKNYYVRIPVGTKEQFIARMNNTPKDKWFKAETHVVRKGETLYQIARKYGVTVSAIRQANNNINPRRLRPGMILVIPYGPTASAKTYTYPKKTKNYTSKSNSNPTSSSKEQSGIIKHKVKPGDTLYSISKRYGISIQKLKKWNNLNSNYIRSGQTLIIYAN
ncbi:MAG: LysM peptidoglycan-binding domain-containing protein [bacterium]|nr:LysM peptidoglycan-binding domain-containing protein [bacterium]